jgi:hypothetical protein
MFSFWKRNRKGKETEIEEDVVLPDKVEVTDILDLHGFFPEEVPEIVDAFIEHALELKLRQVKIIHGKGKSTLKWVVAKMLEAHSAVVDFYDAPPDRGGWGATLVELRPLKRKPVRFSNRFPQIDSDKKSETNQSANADTLNQNPFPKP